MGCDHREDTWKCCFTQPFPRSWNLINHAMFFWLHTIVLSLFLVFLLFLNPPLASIILSHSSLINWLDGRLWYLISLVLLAFGQCTSHLYTIFSNYTINGLDKLKFATESSKTQFEQKIFLYFSVGKIWGKDLCVKCVFLPSLSFPLRKFKRICSSKNIAKTNFNSPYKESV